MVRCVAMQVRALALQIAYVLAESVRRGAVDGTPTPDVTVVPRSESSARTDVKNLVRGGQSGTDRIPEEGEGGPGPGVPVF